MQGKTTQRSDFDFTMFLQTDHDTPSTKNSAKRVSGTVIFTLNFVRNSPSGNSKTKINSPCLLPTTKTGKKESPILSIILACRLDPEI
jgi:hypothetical protein